LKKKCRLDTLGVGSTFWLFGRGFIVREELPDGRRRTECLDDGGEPVLNADWLVEPLHVVAPTREAGA
jgi:hypothetical protein